ncbi:MAG: Hsp20/alpha crystallin family protein [Candidatus Acidiferrum sp.]
MRLEAAEKHSRTGEKINVIAVDADEQARRIHTAIARRAFEIFEKSRSGTHQQEDWRQAESALLRPLCVGRMSLDDSLWVSMDACHFQEGTIEIWVAPRRLTVCGKPRSKGQEAISASTTAPLHEDLMFREVGLPVEVDPSNVAARFKGQSLEILLKKVQVKQEQAVRAAAA